jgi:hypothetical protein
LRDDAPNGGFVHTHQLADEPHTMVLEEIPLDSRGIFTRVAELAAIGTTWRARLASSNLVREVVLEREL